MFEENSLSEVDWWIKQQVIQEHSSQLNLDV